MFRILTSAGCRRLLQHPAVNKRSMRSFSILRNLPVINAIHLQTNHGIPTVLRATKRYQSNETTDVSKLATKDRIYNLITNSDKKVFVFMKGTPEMPQCGFSKAVCQILDAYEVDYDSFNVLADSEIRQGVKEYSSWPTIPQVYVNGSFIGGCDILLQMHQNNELEKLFDDLKPAPETKIEVKEEEFPVSKVQSTDLLAEVPITSLDLVKRIQKVEKKGSFAIDMFTGAYDDEFLVYPEALDNREENKKLKEQAAMVCQLYPQIWDDERQLQKFNFFNLYQLSVSEMMTIFESIGASTRSCTSSSPSLIDSNLQHSIPHQTQVSKAVISLIIRNCLTYRPMFNSENEAVKKHLPQKHILFGGSSEDKELYKPIGFCWTEQAPELGSLPPQEWLTLGQHDQSAGHYLIQGRKTGVLLEESMDKYLIYFRDKFLAQSYETNSADYESNPASDPFVGCCLVDKSQLTISAPYHDSSGCSYVDVLVDTIVPADQVVFPAQRNDPKAVNIKALGQLATGSVIMGILKDSLKMVYKHLLSSKKGLLECDIIQRNLTSVTLKIFALESMVYYIAGMYDGLKEGFDAHMESTILKIVANDYAYVALKELQDICGSDMFIISKLQDQINMFDSFLDGNIYNRLYLSTMGIMWYARSRNMHLNKLRMAPWYPGYFLKNLIRERSQRMDTLTLDADLYGNLHPSLKDAARNLEFIVKRIRFATESLCMRHGKDVTGAQSALYALAQLSIDSFLLTTMCARASKSYCNGSRNCEMDVHLTSSFSHDLVRQTRIYVDEIDTMPMHALYNRSQMINELNLKAGGYYAESPLDPNV